MIVKKKELLKFGIACRVTEKTHKKLSELAEKAGATRSQVLTRLIERAK